MSNIINRPYILTKHSLQNTRNKQRLIQIQTKINSIIYIIIHIHTHMYVYMYDVCMFIYMYSIYAYMHICIYVWKFWVYVLMSLSFTYFTFLESILCYFLFFYYLIIFVSQLFTFIIKEILKLGRIESYSISSYLLFSSKNASTEEHFTIDIRFRFRLMHLFVAE